MPVLDDCLTTIDTQSLSVMGFDVVRLENVRIRAHSPEYQLARLGSDLDVLHFYRWLTHHGRNPEFPEESAGLPFNRESSAECAGV